MRSGSTAERKRLSGHSNAAQPLRWGDLRRIQPISSHYGFDRGTPIDRYYVLKFFEKHQQHIRGDVLEIQMTGYTQMFGRDVCSSESVDIDPQHQTTHVCDLAHSAGILRSNGYDCFLMPNTLNHLRELEPCLQNALRVLNPGGTILATTATLVPLTPDFLDYWRLSPAGWKEVVTRVWPGCQVSIESYGNVLAATAAMMGLACEELTTQELDVRDPRYPVLIGVACHKPS